MGRKRPTPEAEKVLLQVRELVGSIGPRRRGKGPRFRWWALEWFDKFARLKRKPATLYQRRHQIQAYLVPAIGRRRLADIGPHDVEAVRQHMDALSPRTINGALVCLNMILHEAKEAGHLERVPRIRLSAVVSAKKDVREADEYAQIVDAARQLSWRHHLAVLLTGDAGLRSSEAAGLERDRLDMDTRIIDVSAQAWKTTLLIAPKGNRPRIVGMTTQLYEALKAAPTSEKTTRVLWGVWGRAIGRGMIRRWVREAVIAAGFDPAGGAHIFRHQWLTDLADAGATLGAMMELGGWRDAKIASNYLHGRRSSVQTAIALLERKRRNDSD